MFLPIAIVAIIAIGIFIFMNYASQKRRDKNDERRESIKEKMEEIIQSLKNKGDNIP
jgi:preprotein translocase subunit YajC